MSDAIIVSLLLLVITGVWALVQHFYKDHDWTEHYDDDDPNKPF